MLAAALVVTAGVVVPVHSFVAQSATPFSGQDGSTAAGSQGVVTALPDGPGATTVSGTGAYAGLKVTVNQTQNLTNQAVSISWTGGEPTFSQENPNSFTSTFNGDYLQIFQCWSAPDASGPTPQQCQFGAESPNPLSAYPIPEQGHEYSRVLTQQSWPNWGQIPGFDDATDGYTIEPFDAVDGTVVNQQADYNYLANQFAPLPFWLNPYFSFSTTNEIDFARTSSDGTGNQLFTVDTGLEAPGLGCGQSIEPEGGTTVTPKCWIVVVPRGTPEQENPAGLSGVSSVVTSPLAPSAWANRITIPLQFNPVGSDCSITQQSTGIAGDELAAPAMASWQPALCDQPGSPSYSYLINSDDSARSNLAQPTYGSVGLSVFSNPVDPTQLSTPDPVAYAPLTLSGVVVAFNIDRVPGLDGSELNPDEVPLEGDRISHIYLTPRLVAKLLTESYQDQIQGVLAARPAAYSWVLKNPTSIFSDPDFLQFNPEFADLSTQYLTQAGNLVVEETNSDATAELWKWVLGDHEAAAWLAGTPDQWGMQVNPYYSTNAALNPSGVAFGATPLESYPKSDPYCLNTKEQVYGPPTAPARPKCILDWDPYVQSFRAGAQATAASNPGTKTTFDPTKDPNNAWTADGPQYTGQSMVMTITDSASAAQYGLQTASLSQDGDDGTSRTFIAPDSAGLVAGEGAMTASPTSPGVLLANPTTSAPGAYPLSILTYAATQPATLTAAEQHSYAQLISYATGAGQVVGSAPGQLPAGMVPLPASLVAEAKTAVKDILDPSLLDSTTETSTSASSAASAFTPDQYLTTPATPPIQETESVSPASKSAAPVTPAALVAVRSTPFPIGAKRWLLPGILVLGLLAAGAALALSRRTPTATTSPGDA